MEVVVDALQIARNYSGLGRQVLAIGRELARLPEDVPIELRCAADAVPAFSAAFPPRTVVRAPIPGSRPRPRRIWQQQVAAPAADSESTLLISLGDQGPVWGKARVLLAVNDVRRLAHPETAPASERLFYRALVPRAVRHAYRVVTISEFSRQEIRRLLGVDARVVADHPPPRVESAPDNVRGHVLVVGADRPYKGLDTIVDALERMSPDDRPRVVVAGEGRRLLSPYVEAAGWVDEATLDRLYRTASATVSASRYEGYGLPVAESLSYGIPTIASDIPPHREVAGDAAVYFAPGDSAALAEALASAPGRRDLGERALERSRELARLRPRWADVIMEALG